MRWLHEREIPQVSMCNLKNSHTNGLGTDTYTTSTLTITHEQTNKHTHTELYYIDIFNCCGVFVCIAYVHRCVRVKCRCIWVFKWPNMWFYVCMCLCVRGDSPRQMVCALVSRVCDVTGGVIGYIVWVISGVVLWGSLCHALGVCACVLVLIYVFIIMTRPLQAISAFLCWGRVTRRPRFPGTVPGFHVLSPVWCRPRKCPRILLGSQETNSATITIKIIFLCTFQWFFSYFN